MTRLTFCMLCICNVVKLSVGSIEVQTSLGPIRGRLVQDDITDTSYYSYEGIPYAEPPVGELRFKPPVRKQPWSTVFNATKPGRVCPQTELYYSKEEMDEDCLYFNIHVPANRSSELLPVFFHIHGGDFVSQSGNSVPIHGPQFLIRHNVVVVTMNYRLGALGFLSLCSEEVSGNAGVKDVLLVLKTVHENIINFGGNPNKITVKGNCAGAAITGLLMLTDQTDGFIHNVMFHSGNLLSAKYMQSNPRENAMSLASELGLDTSDDATMLEQLKLVDAFDIVRAQEAITRKDPQRGFRIFRPFKPTVEVEHANAIITKSPLESVRKGAIRDVPIFMGFNDQEGIEVFQLLNSEPELIDRLNENFELLIPEDIRYPLGSAARGNLSARIRDFYFGGGNITWVDVQNFINLISDWQYVFPNDLFVTLFKEKMNSAIYYFVFGADSELNWLKTFANITYPGASHDDDLGYVFLTSVTEPIYQNVHSSITNLQDTVLTLVQYFINNGVPSKDGAWPEAGQENNHYAIYNNGAVPVYRRPFPERMAFWRSVYEEYFNSTWSDTYRCTNTNVVSVQ